MKRSEGCAGLDYFRVIAALLPMAVISVLLITKLLNAQTFVTDHSVIFFVVVSVFSLIAAFVIFLLQSRLTSAKIFQKNRAWIEIDLKNLRRNVETFRTVLDPQCKLMAVVKANAYGHGIKEISKELNRAGVDAFAVATIYEAVALRKNGIKGDILILGFTCPNDFKYLSRYHLTQTVLDAGYAKTLEQYGRKLKIHIKIDTGMHRFGEKYDNIQDVEQIFKYCHLTVKGVFTHLCAADSLKAADRAFSSAQIMRFYSLIEDLRGMGYDTGKLHIQSSYGVLNYPELRCDYARIGIALYGILSSGDAQTIVPADLCPVLSLKARVVLIKEISSGETVSYGRLYTAPNNMKIGVVSIGYADGIPRSYHNGYVLIHGRRAFILGRICMDTMMIDLTDIEEAQTGDIVTVIGADGEKSIRSEEVAEKCGTITNELLSRLGSRLERITIGM